MLLQRRITLASLLLLASAVALLPVQVAAQDTINSVLERIRIQESRHFSYLETRYLQLLADPWQATGNMYISPQQMIIAQQSPKVVTTIISTDRMLHIDVEQDIDHSLKLEQPFAVPGMEPFMQLLYGTTGDTELQQDYMTSFDITGQRWLLQLVPRQHLEHEIIRMQVSGDKGSGPDNLLLETADGDRTEWQLSLLSQGTVASQEMQQALDQLSAH